MTGLPVGTVIEMTVTKPGAQPRTTNVRLTEEDLAAINKFKDMGGKQ